MLSPTSSKTQLHDQRSSRSAPIVSLCPLKIMFPFTRTVLMFFIAGLLFIVPRARRTLGAYRIPRETGLLMEGVTTLAGSGSVDDGTVACRRQNLYNCPVTARRVAASNCLCVVLRIIVASLLFSSALTAVEPDRRFCSGSPRRRVSGLHNRTRA